MKVAVLFSGHIRTHYRECFENIKRNIYDPILNNGSTVDTFMSTWDITGDRSNGITETSINVNDLKNALNIFGNVTLEIEENKKEFFIQNFKDPDYNRMYSCPTTYPDSVSMHYKLHKVYTLMINKSPNYDIVIRLRPDILFDKPLDYQIILNAFFLKKLYMPEWHQKYPEVTCGMMDQFAFGVPSVISIYCSVYSKLKYLPSDTIKCGEGLLYSVVRGLPIIRFKVTYSLRRINSIDRLI